MDNEVQESQGVCVCVCVVSVRIYWVIRAGNILDNYFFCFVSKNLPPTNHHHDDDNEEHHGWIVSAKLINFYMAHLKLQRV